MSKDELLKALGFPEPDYALIEYIKYCDKEGMFSEINSDIEDLEGSKKELQENIEDVYPMINGECYYILDDVVNSYSRLINDLKALKDYYLKGNKILKEK